MDGDRRGTKGSGRQAGRHRADAPRLARTASRLSGLFSRLRSRCDHRLARSTGEEGIRPRHADADAQGGPRRRGPEAGQNPHTQGRAAPAGAGEGTPPAAELRTLPREHPLRPGRLVRTVARSARRRVLQEMQEGDRPADQGGTRPPPRAARRGSQTLAAGVIVVGLFFGITAPVCDVIRPPPFVRTADFAEREITLPPGSEIRGKFRLDLFPHAREPLDCFDDPYIRTISLQWASRLGKKVFAQACLARIARYNPNPSQI